MKLPQIKITIKTLNNKTRKGDYFKVSSKGQKTRYYKIKDVPQQLDTVTKHYTNKYITKKGEQNYKKLEKAWKETTKKPKDRQPELKKTIKEITTYIQKIRKRGTITQQIKTGISSITIDPTKPITNTLKNKIMKTLLKDMVLDKTLLKVFATEENFNKLNHRLDYNFTGKDQENKKNIEANVHGKTLNQALNEAQQATKQPETEGKYKLTRYLKEKQWFAQSGIETQQTPTKYTLTITLRKGKENTTIEAK